MKRQIETWKLIRDSLQKQIPVTLLYVVESKGSSPGRQGFFMAVNANGEMSGSIGGGVMEHKFVELAKDKLRASTAELQIRKQFHDKSISKDRSGMICSGEQTVLIYPVSSNEKEPIEGIVHTLEEKGNGTFQISPAGIELTKDSSDQDHVFEFRSETDWLYREKIGYKNHIYIIGGGHCALALSRIMATMDFYIHLFDEREGLNTMEQNEWVHEKVVVKNYEELGSLIPSGSSAFLVIMSFGYRTDAIALKALLGKEFRYLGILGSRKKIGDMFEDFRKDGVSEEVLNNIHSPIGISINSQTPEEIAISIAAEIIGIKNS